MSTRSPAGEPPPLTAFGKIAVRTLAHYSAQAEAFWQGTRDHDVSQNRAALLEALPSGKQLRLLDFGCGPGRDLAAFRDLGHIAVGLDGCPEFVRMARMHSGCEVLPQNFFELDLGAARFDGVFANAALFHVPASLLPRVLQQLAACLVSGGALFCSNPRALGEEWEGWRGERYGTYLSESGWTERISAAGLVLEHSFLRPTGRPPAEQPWLAMVWRQP